VDKPVGGELVAEDAVSFGDTIYSDPDDPLISVGVDGEGDFAHGVQ
jgi:hypothetical protein